MTRTKVLFRSMQRYLLKRNYKSDPRFFDVFNCSCFCLECRFCPSKISQAIPSCAILFRVHFFPSFPNPFYPSCPQYIHPSPSYFLPTLRLKASQPILIHPVCSIPLDHSLASYLFKSPPNRTHPILFQPVVTSSHFFFSHAIPWRPILT